ncbi:unnamed protein product [Spodoptera exigua]|nr:unnamed protein product [Spodoptera exigua]
MDGEVRTRRYADVNIVTFATHLLPRNRRQRTFEILTTLGLTRQTIDRADESSSLLLSRQSDRDGERCGGHDFGAFSELGEGKTSGGGNHVPWPRHHDTSAGATPTTIASPNRTIMPSDSTRQHTEQ